MQTRLSIARAFRGELGTNDPAEESAEELLKDILGVEAPLRKRAKPVVIPKSILPSLKNDLEKKIVKLFLQRGEKALPVKEIMSVSSKTFDVLDCLCDLEQRKVISKLKDGNYILAG
ncbi:MAG: hypothetical protein E7425_08640 [Ruminococcaceae bacterium]|nr:hypothetical protein [Oscillospiraceae bacterium]